MMSKELGQNGVSIETVLSMSDVDLHIFMFNKVYLREQTSPTRSPEAYSRETIVFCFKSEMEDIN